MLITFVAIDGIPTIRITIEGQSKDYPLRHEQVRMLLRQMVLWLTK